MRTYIFLTVIIVNVFIVIYYHKNRCPEPQAIEIEIPKLNTSIQLTEPKVVNPKEYDEYYLASKFLSKESSAVKGFSHNGGKGHIKAGSFVHNYYYNIALKVSIPLYCN